VNNFVEFFIPPAASLVAIPFGKTIAWPSSVIS